jgi:hypothetical protein
MGLTDGSALPAVLSVLKWSEANIRRNAWYVRLSLVECSLAVTGHRSRQAACQTVPESSPSNDESHGMPAVGGRPPGCFCDNGSGGNGNGAPTVDVRRRLRGCLESCHWLVADVPAIRGLRRVRVLAVSACPRGLPRVGVCEFAARSVRCFQLLWRTGRTRAAPRCGRPGTWSVSVCPDGGCGAGPANRMAISTGPGRRVQPGDLMRGCRRPTAGAGGC